MPRACRGVRSALAAIRRVGSCRRTRRTYVGCENDRDASGHNSPHDSPFNSRGHPAVMTDRPISRRDLLRGRLGSLLRVESTPWTIADPPAAIPPNTPSPGGDQLAVIRPHVCLAHRWHRDAAAGCEPTDGKASPCRGCLDACPTPNAIVPCSYGPSIDPDRCTGCGDCLVACPSPVLAIALVPRTTSAPAPGWLSQGIREAPPAPP